MKNLKIIIIATTIAVLAVATIGVALAQNYGNTEFYGGMMGYSTPNTDDDWWTVMQEHMDDQWGDVQDEEWNNDMRAYMDEHLDEIESKPWFDEMTAYMEEQNFGRNYRYGYGCH